MTRADLHALYSLQTTPPPPHCNSGSRVSNGINRGTVYTSTIYSGVGGDGRASRGYPITPAALAAVEGAVAASVNQ